MKKYGLQLRVQPQQKKQPTKPSIPAPLGFNDEDDDDNVEREIMRQAYKNKTHKDIEEQHKKALEEDPSVFDYDGVYDKMKEKQVLPAQQERVDRKPRYIQTLMDKAKQRERDHEISYERKLAKERSKDEHLYADKDKYFTSAYKKKLAEQAKWIEEERLREMREARDDVTKKTDLTDFYKNIAFGADSSKKPEKQAEEVAAQPPTHVSPPLTVTSPETSRTVQDRDEIPENIPPKTKDEPSASNRVTPGDQKKSEDAVVEAKNHRKRSEDAVAAATERYLVRKRSKLESINETLLQSLVV